MIFLGDTHGNNGHIKMLIRDRNYRDTNLIHVGDFGVGFIEMEQEIKNLQGLNDYMAEKNLVLHVVRGNHDNPYYFDGTFMYSNLKLHPDYTVINIDGKNILLVGGAISIDRVPRRRENLIEIKVNNHSERRYFWEAEKFNLDKDKLETFRDIDIVVTHTAPHFCFPTNQVNNWPHIVSQFMSEDKTLGDDLITERNQLTEMYDILIKNNNNIQYYMYGHFHQHNINIFRNCLFICLEINQFYEIIK